MAKTAGTEAHRDKILRVALALLTKEGRDAVTTRSVAEYAKVQPPVIYRLFGDKRGLLDAVAAHGFSTYVAKKHSPETQEDPVEALRNGWNVHVEFGLANPELYLLMYASPRPGHMSAAARQAFGMLEQHMQRVAVAGRLRVSVARACALYHAAATGTVLFLLSTTPEQRDLQLSSTSRDRALAGITQERAAIASSTPAAVANQLCELLSSRIQEEQVFSDAEQLLLTEWLQRLANRSDL